MHWLAEQLGGAGSAFVGAYLGASTASTHCSCHFESSPVDEGLLTILRAQLDRCGPERLHAAAAPVCAQPVGGFLVAAGLGLLLGMATTLDSDIIQILVDYVDDPNSLWHHRLLLFELGPGRWVCATPDFSVQVIDLSQHRVLPLARAAPWPAQVRGNVYGFDPLTADQRDDLFLRGGQLARVLGHQPGNTAAAADRQWRVSDTGHEKFNEVVADGNMLGDRAVVKGDTGLYCIDEGASEWVSVQRVRVRDHDAWLEKKRSGPGRDLRILPVHRDAGGKRAMLLRESINLFREPKFPDWPFEGPSAAKEVLGDVAAAGLELHLYPTWWESKSGVNPTGSVAREVRLAFDYLRMLQAYDQTNMVSLAAVELICRRIVVCQKAVRRNPKAPDFTGLERFVLSNFDESGGLKTTEFDKYMAEQQKASAVALKSMRQDVEEQENEKKRQAAGIAGLGQFGGAPFFEVLSSPCDTFPLPTGSALDMFGRGDRAASRRLPTRAGDEPSAAALVSDAVAALNGLASARIGRPLQVRRSRPAEREVTSAQQSILDRVAERVDDQFPAPPDASFSSALPDLLKCADMYLTSESSSRVPIQLERLKILQNSTMPKEALDVVGADARKLLADPWRYIERRANDVEADGPPPRPYTDPRLRFSRELMKELVLTLHRGNLVVFRPSVKAFIGLFTVVKKDGWWQRLIVDARVPNHWHRRPPHSYLATPGAASALDLSDAALEPGDAAVFYGSMVAVLSERGFTLRDNVECDANLDMVGFELQGAKFVWRQRRSRFWRLWHALRQLELRGGCAGEVMRIILGHLVNFFMLSRPALSVLSRLYVFSTENLGRYRRFDGHVRGELVTCRGLLALVRSRLRPHHYPVAFCSDASTRGYAIHSGQIDPHLLYDVCRWRERWRFAVAEEGEGPGIDGAQTGLDADFRELGADLDIEDGDWDRRGDRAVPVRRAPRVSSLVPAEALRAAELGLPHPRVTGIVPALPDTLVAPTRWRRLLVGAWQRREAIHMKEARIALVGLYHAVRDPASHGGVVLSLGDNLSEVLATERGRAHDPALNSVCRRAAAVELGAEARWVRRYVETDRNPTDSDSRLAEQGILAPGESLRGGRLAARLRRLREGACCPDRVPDGAPRAAASSAAAPAPPAGPQRRPPWPGARGPSRRRDRAGVLEIFGGSCRFSGACAAAGLRILCPVDVSAGPHFNVLSIAVQQKILHWISHGYVCHVHIATPCTRWSVANATGAPDSEGSRAGLGCADFTVRVLKMCHRCGVSVSLENPRSSRLLKYPPLVNIFEKLGCVSFEYHCCRYGAPYLKPTVFVTNVPSLSVIERACVCTVPHERLEGKVKIPDETGKLVWKWKTSLAGAYPPGLCRVAARGLKEALGPGALRRDGEPALDPRWERELAAAAGFPQPKPLEVPSCPRRFTTGWEHAVGHQLCGDSAEQRRQATLTSGGRPPQGLLLPDGVDSRPPTGDRRRRAATRQAVAKTVKVSPGEKGYLKQRSVGGATLRLYQREYEMLVAWWKAQRLSTVSTEAHDEALERYLDKLFFDGEPASRANNVVHALMYHIDEVWAKTPHFPRTRRALRGFRKASQTRSRDGCPWEAALALAHWMGRQRTPFMADSAALTLVLFDGYLRASEGLGLGRDQLIPPQGGRGARRCWAAMICPEEEGRPTKSGDFDDTVIFGDTSEARRPLLTKILQVLHRTTEAGALVFDGLSLSSYERVFRRGTLELGLENLRLTPHCLRHGGASTDGLDDLPIVQIQKRGRWKSLASCKRYEKKGRLLKQLDRLKAVPGVHGETSLQWLLTQFPRILQNQRVMS
ncbi:unnamed protein product [Prorocentrum cordatum]|uniref:Uncharacterized protein n=1 Tax=Prorocentrum cordatum TaxID=2364126 RepID=A0ABN9R0C0_9DINO|nr:unnamed protein product [Polarella glacialis]